MAGDRVVITMEKNRAGRMQVSTSIDGQPFDLTADFRALPQDGPTYAARTVVRVPATQLDIQIENFDYITDTAPPVSKVTLHRSGQTFNAIVDKDVTVEGRPIIPRRTRAVGRLMQVTPAGKSAGAKMSLVTAVELDRGPTAVQTNAIALQAESTAKKDTARVVGGTALGAIIGGIAGGGSGAGIDALVGGGAGTVAAVATKDKDVPLDSEVEIVYQLAVPVALSSR